MREYDMERIIDRFIDLKKEYSGSKEKQQAIEDAMRIVYEDYRKPLQQEGGLGYNDKNWNEVLYSLDLKEDTPDVYGVTHLYTMPGWNSTTWHYETEEQKRDLYYFLSGMVAERTARKIISQFLL